MATVKKTAAIKLLGSYGLERAQELAKQLKAALAPHAMLELDLSGLTELDLSAVQLLYAAKKSAKAGGGDLLLVGTINPSLAARLLSSTLISRLVSDGPSLAAALPSFLSIEVER